MKKNPNYGLSVIEPNVLKTPFIKAITKPQLTGA